jgi:MerR family transcriptional regulator, redox-sensitive transcriptional activator SoxR
MTTIPIGEVARRTGLSQSTIRYYEAEGLVAAPQRTSGWRQFGVDVVDRLQVIRTARELGFSLDDIRVLLDGFSSDTPPAARWQQLARRKLPEVDALVQQATAMKRLLEKGLRCDCVSVQDCILYECNPPVSIARRQS